MERNELIISFVPLVDKVAKRLYSITPFSLDADDLIGEGHLELITVCDEAISAKVVPAAGYVRNRIRWSMLRFIRTSDPAPYSIHRKITVMQKYIQKQQLLTGSSPSMRELKTHFNFTQKQLDRLIRYQYQNRTAYLEDEYEARQFEPYTTNTELEGLQYEQLYDIASKATKTLPEQQKRIAHMVLEGKENNEIAKALNKSSKNVETLKGQAMKILRKHLITKGFAL